MSDLRADAAAPPTRARKHVPRLAPAHRVVTALLSRARACGRSLAVNQKLLDLQCMVLSPPSFGLSLGKKGKDEVQMPAVRSEPPKAL